MAEKITDKLVRMLTPDGRVNITFDTEIKGFGVRVTRGGTKSFILDYRISGRQRRYTIGQYPTWGVTAARAEAKNLRMQIDRGHDPMGARHIDRTAPTIDALCDLYIERHLPRKRPSSGRDDLSMIDKYIRPTFGKIKVENLTHAQIDSLHRKITKSAPYRANRLIALMSKMLSLAIKWELRADNPAKGVERNVENRRERFLSEVELARLTDALNKHPKQKSANVVRLLMLTGARRGEVLGATWGEIDFEAGTWIKPRGHTKQKREHRIPLAAPTLALLSDMRERAISPYLFPGRSPNQPMTEIKKFWASVCNAADIKDCRLHDLRHTYASILVSRGATLPLIGALLGHTQTQTTARYAHLYDDPLRAATEAVAQVVAPDGDSGGE